MKCPECKNKNVLFISNPYNGDVNIECKKCKHKIWRDNKKYSGTVLVLCALLILVYLIFKKFIRCRLK